MKFFLTFLLAFSTVFLSAQTSPTVRFDSIADMLAYTIPSVNSKLSAIVSGGTSATGDSFLAGEFAYSAASTATTNTYAVFKPLGTTGRWIRITGATYNQTPNVTLPSGSDSYAFQLYRGVGTNAISIGASATNALIQSFSSLPLFINPVGGNNVILNEQGGNVGIGKPNPSFYRLYVLDSTGDAAVAIESSNAGGSSYIKFLTPVAAASAVVGKENLAGGVFTGTFANSAVFGSQGTNATQIGSGAIAGMLMRPDNQYIGMGSFNPQTTLHVSSSLTTSPRGITSAQYDTGTNGARLHMRKSRGTEAAPTIVSTGDDLGNILWSGYDGAAYQEMASIRSAVTGTVAANRVPTQLIFSTATDAATSVLTDAMTITAAQRVGIGTGTVSSMLDIQGTSAMDLPTYSAEFLSAAGWTSTDWTGSFVAGWTHTVGNTTALSQATAAVSATKYQITYTVTGRTAGSFTVSFGGQSLATLTATGSFGPTTTSTANLTVTPTTDFDGTIVLSIKSITAASTPSFVIKGSDGVSRVEVRTGLLGSTFIGFESGSYNTTGVYNTGYGYQALYFNTTGIYNTAIGYKALRSNTIGIYNVANGYQAQYSNLTGANNVANGFQALYSNTTASNNAGNGFQALYSNTTGGENVANGFQALYSNTTAAGNTAIGFQALYFNTTGAYNAAIGYQALRSNTSGTYNVASGYLALYGNTTGTYNIASGYAAGRYIANGSTANTTGDFNVFVGSDTKALADNDQNEIVIGYNATGLGSNSVVLGNSSVTLTALRGSVGINTTAPDKALEVNSATGANFRLTYNDADGSAANYADFSMSSGGNLTIAPSGGLASITGGISTSVQSLSGPGLVTLTTGITEVTTTGVADALALANGVAGQEKTIIHGVDGGSFVLTPTTKTGWSTYTSTVAGESITLVYLTTRGWIVKGSYLGTIAP